MSVKETPLAAVKRLHGSKEKLVDDLVQKLAKDSDESSGDMKQRLMTVSNKKLIRLSVTLQQVQEKYGSKESLIDAVSQARGKTKDQDFKDKLARLPLPQLLDMTRASN